MESHASLKAADGIQGPPTCTICNAPTKKHFSKEFLGTTVDYCLCSVCGHLTARQLGLAINYSREQYFREIDTGWEDRNAIVFHLVSAFLRSSRFKLSPQSAVLDFGCGVGRLVEELNRAGFNVWGFEPYADSFDSSGRVLRDWAEVRRTLGSIDLMTCIEVLEHLRNPDRFVAKASQLIKDTGYILISTGIFRKRFHGADWYYLNPAAGHVSIFTERSLEILLARHGFEPVLRASELLWLFRKTGSRRRRMAEKGVFLASQARVKTKVEAADIARRVFGADWQPPKSLRGVWDKL